MGEEIKSNTLRIDSKFTIASVLKMYLKECEYKLKCHIEEMGVHKLTLYNDELQINIDIGTEKEMEELFKKYHLLFTNSILSDELKKPIIHYREKS